MQVQFDPNIRNGITRFGRLGTWYILALTLVAAVAVFGQVLIQSHLRSQLGDSRVVNVAGKQRMLSQQLAKTALLLRESESVAERLPFLEDLKASIALLKRSQEGLRHGDDSLNLSGRNSEEVMRLFQQVQDDFNGLYNHALAIIAILEHDSAASRTSLEQPVDSLLQHEKRFLVGMEEIVSQFDVESNAKVSTLRATEYIVLAIVLLVMILEVIFIFRPTTQQVNQTISKLAASEKNAQKLSHEIGALYASLEKTYEAMAIVNQPVENPRLLAKADKGGNVTFVSEAFAGSRAVPTPQNSARLSDLFPGLDQPDDWVDDVVDTVSEGKAWQGELKFRNGSQENSWLDAVITPVYNDRDEIEELLMLGSDISSRKTAEQNMNLKNRAEIERKINQQKFRSVLILEGQEEERKRIAMDIHDGIGQMLTSLKFQIESIDLNQGAAAREKISEVGQLIKEIIKEVRKVTFNLKPTVLGDYGLQAGLNVFVQEIGKLTGIDIQYRTSGSIARMPQKIENNIFRIIQEAINNAIKYSAAEKITVSLKQLENELSITVTDEGKGFDTKIVEAGGANLESGRGFFNMCERTEYVNGKLDIRSGIGAGTTVRLTVPLRSTFPVE